MTFARQRDMVDIAAPGHFRAGPLPLRQVNVHQVDQVRTGSKLAHRILRQVVVDGAADHLGVETGGLVHVAHQKDDVVEPLQPERRAHSFTSILPVLAPVKRPRKASGMVSRPSNTVSCDFTLPLAISSPIPRWNSSSRET